MAGKQARKKEPVVLESVLKALLEEKAHAA